tara:strand:+ start:29605 stop:30618 length:1014 start_codon:yes stop_codon:yes gene_type:complete
MMKLSASIISLLITLIFSATANAVGVAAGTSIANTATVDFTIGGTAGVATDTDIFQVQEIINVDVAWQDAANVMVSPGASQQVLTFIVTNTGNGVEAFSLQIDNTVIVTDDFDPVNGLIYLDGNGNGVFDGAPIDPVYTAGSNDPVLNANGIDTQIIFLVSDIPAGGTAGQTGESELTVDALTPGASGAAAGTNLDGAGDGGIDAVVGVSQANDRTTGIYEIDVSPVDVGIVKSSQVISNGNGCSAAPCSPVPGATIRYSLQVNISGVGTVNSLVITDPIPNNTTYLTESISLNNASLTDSSADADAGNFSANTVTVDLGDISSAATHLITFDVTIN